MRGLYREYDRQSAGNKVRLSVLAAAVLMSIGVGQVLADDGPVEFTAGVTARGTETCTFEVAHSGPKIATVVYRKGAAGAELSGHESLLTVTAVGGSRCFISRVRISGSDNATTLPDYDRMRVLMTKSGTGYIPVAYIIGDLKATNADGGDVTGSVRSEGASGILISATVDGPKVGYFKNKVQRAVSGIKVLAPRQISA